jgi:hypothetical protein
MRRTGADLAQPLERLLSPAAVAGNHDDAGAPPGELFGRDPADARRRAGDDDDFSLDGTALQLDWRMLL